MKKPRTRSSPLTRGRGSKRPPHARGGGGADRRPSRGGVDRNGRSTGHAVEEPRRPSRGGVDRNGEHPQGQPLPSLVSPLTRGRGSKPPPSPSPALPLPSPLTRGRGSKRLIPARHNGGLASPLTRGRGSKPPVCGLPRHRARSPLTRGRGSKPAGRQRPPDRRRVAPHAGAWIETLAPPARRFRPSRRPSRGGVDRNRAGSRGRRHGRWSPLTRGRGSKRLLGRGLNVGQPGRPSRGGVDRNPGGRS